MRKITAIAVMTVRAALRSRVLAAAALFLITVMVGLPFVIKGDGTPESQASIFINYAFGLLMFVLSLTATWCGAGAISLEISGCQMQNLVTKPLRSVQIWAGKLLGLMTINLLLLALGGVLICAMLHWTIRPARIGGARHHDLRREIMTVYHTVPPLKTSSPQGGAAAIGPGRSYRWRFNIARQAAGAQFALLKFRFIPSPFSHQSPVTGTWRAFTGKNPDLLNKTTAASPNMTVYLNVPLHRNFNLVGAPLVGDRSDGRAHLPAVLRTALQAGARPLHSNPDPSGFLELEYLNLQTNPPVTVFFSEDDLRLLIPESSFEANLLRGLIMGFARLSFFTSLGMIAGALFTFPVAVFASMGLLATAFSGGFMRQLAERGWWINVSHEQLSPSAAILNEIVRGSFRFLAAILPPLDRFDPLAFLPESLFIPWSLAGESFAVLCVLYPLILMLIGARCLRRREVGLSSE